jgi:hypothetical protein
MRRDQPKKPRYAFRFPGLSQFVQVPCEIALTLVENTVKIAYFLKKAILILGNNCSLVCAKPMPGLEG